MHHFGLSLLVDLCLFSNYGAYYYTWFVLDDLGVPFVEKHQSLETSSKILSFLVTFYLWCSGAHFLG